jgi:hypothetical protein
VSHRDAEVADLLGAAFAHGQNVFSESFVAKPQTGFKNSRRAWGEIAWRWPEVRPVVGVCVRQKMDPRATSFSGIRGSVDWS